ncbi:helix-turn-helix domain-containing protein [Paenibacillus doosanensis]|uniref:HTH-type transcriptional activator RhaR n=1 Tax=Paenibacillus konkukensis TaxID=2020716 RepID=A0ABY4RNF5_9BACL|nr:MULTISPECIES: helix-turn-helix domain-containing protein [Paenibacillus]MCS7462118.1 helix-turn-helix domain-containing protein [Paenibacillus doosanensis]UQZ83500.1 HTH-type transcriptional activator RhaR [Paenibacillus konkukensis]
MHTIIKQFPESGDFPFHFVYKDTKSPQNELSDHMHEWYEIVYVHRGEGLFFIDQAFYPMAEGDVFLIPGDTIHRAMPDKHHPVTSSIVYFGERLLPDISLGESFSLPLLFRHIQHRQSYRASLDFHDRKRWARHIEEVKEESDRRGQGYRFALRLILHRMLLELARSERMSFQESVPPAPTRYPWLHEMLGYIDAHLDRPLSLSSLAKEALVSPEHFTRVFKQMTGLRLTDYIHSKRIVKAKRLLRHSALPTHEIAVLCGFESLPHFHRIFKKHTESTPAAWRRASRG